MYCDALILRDFDLFRLTGLILGGVCRLFPKMYGALAIVRPETVIRWHRGGFRSYWRWKSKHRCGRPAVTVEIRQLICQMSGDNPLDCITNMLGLDLR